MKPNNKDILILFLIVLLPFVFFIYNIVPEEVNVWKTRWFQVDSGFFIGVDFLFWLLSVKFLTLFILSLWFLTCLHKWRLIILIPIYVEIYKIYVNLKIVDYGFKYDFSFFESLLFSIPFTAILLILSKQLGYYKNVQRLKLNEEINDKMIKLSKFDLKGYKEIKKEFKGLKNQKSVINEKDYLVRLIALRDKMTL